MVRHLYIHIPFCHHICPYCAFYKHRPGKLANAAFVEALLAEARAAADEYEIQPETIYFGGGTPSLLSPLHLETLCSGLSDIFSLDQLREWSIESNPSTFDLAKAKLMRDLGITRPSLGVQSFQASTLKTLGRDHTPEAGREAFECLRDAGFDNISLDLMFSIPGQSPEEWEGDLATAVQLNPQHISCYNLTYEEDTAFMTQFETGELDFCEDRDASYFYRAIENLEAEGFVHYEISNYARPGFESRHNQAYWEGEDYLGLGPSAVSTIDDRRWKNLPDTAAWVAALNENGNGIKVEKEKLGEEDRRLESIAMRLRTKRGLPLEFVEDSSQVDSLIEQGLIFRNEDRYCLTRHGKALVDSIAAHLI